MPRHCPDKEPGRQQPGGPRTHSIMPGSALRSESTRRNKESSIRNHEDDDREEDALTGVLHVDPSTKPEKSQEKTPAEKPLAWSPSGLPTRRKRWAHSARSLADEG